MNGFGYVVGQATLLLLIAAVLGVLIGRYLLPTRSRGPAGGHGGPGGIPHTPQTPTGRPAVTDPPDHTIGDPEWLAANIEGLRAKIAEKTHADPPDEGTLRTLEQTIERFQGRIGILESQLGAASEREQALREQLARRGPQPS